MIGDMKTCRAIHVFAFAAVGMAILSACQPVDKHTSVRRGPGGAIEIQNTPLSEEEIARRKQRYVPAAPEDTELAQVEALWPQLTAAQREEVLQKVKELTGEQ